MTIFKSVYDVERDDVTVGIKKKYDGFNEGILASYQINFDDVTIAKMKELQKRIESFHSGDADEEELDSIQESIRNAAFSLAETAPEEIAYTLEGYADHSGQYHDEFTLWIERVFEVLAAHETVRNT